MLFQNCTAVRKKFRVMIDKVGSRFIRKRTDILSINAESRQCITIASFSNFSSSFRNIIKKKCKSIPITVAACFFNAFPRARNDSMLMMSVHGRARVKENMYVDMI